MNRRDYLCSLSGTGFSSVLAGCNTIGTRSPEDIRIQERPTWLEGSFTNTRMRKDGSLVLDDFTVLEDDFGWETPEKSQFGWDVQTPGESEIIPNPAEGHLEFRTSNTDEIAEIVQGNDKFVDFTQHPDWRLTFVERNAQSSVGAAWEFWFKNPQNDGRRWVLIDGGGGGNVANEATEDDTCGESVYYTRRDQLLTQDGVNGHTHCWDEFEDAPINHSTRTKLTLEVMGSQNEITAYVDDRYQADLRAEDGQFILSGEHYGPAVRLHDRGDHDENGYLYYVGLQKVGYKQPVGYYESTFTAAAPVEWERINLQSTVPNESGYDLQYRVPGGPQWYQSLDSVPKSRTLRLRIRLYTNRLRTTPQIHGIDLSTA